MRETMNRSVSFGNVSAPTGHGVRSQTAPRGVAAAPRGMTGKKTAVRRKAKKRSLSLKFPRTLALVLTAVLVYLVAMGLLFQHSRITELNEEIRAKQTELTAITNINDSKEGKIVSHRDLSAVEAEARSYGMTEPDASQFVYEDSLNTAAQTEEKTSRWGSSN